MFLGPVSGAPSGTGRAGFDTSQSLTSLPGARRGQDLAVRAERDRVEREIAVGRLQRLPDRRGVTGVGHVPQPQRAVRADRGEQPPVRRDGDRLHDAGRVRDSRGGGRVGRFKQGAGRLLGARDAVGGDAELGGQRRVEGAELRRLVCDLARVRILLGGDGDVPRGGGLLALLERVPGE